MSASDNLNPLLFHGTNVKMNVGDIIQPSTKAGHSPTSYKYSDDQAGKDDDSHSRGDHVFMLPTERAGWDWADHRTHEESEASQNHPTPYDQRSPRVYEVEPVGGDYHPGDIGVPGGSMLGNERVTQRGAGARIVREHVIPTPESGPVQGQLPDVNWNAHKVDEGRNSDERTSNLRSERTHVRNQMAEEDTRKPGQEAARPVKPDPNQGKLF